jgi:hypothetical protein
LVSARSRPAKKAPRVFDSPMPCVMKDMRRTVDRMMLKNASWEEERATK